MVKQREIVKKIKDNQTSLVVKSKLTNLLKSFIFNNNNKKTNTNIKANDNQLSIPLWIVLILSAISFMLPILLCYLYVKLAYFLRKKNG